MPTFVTDLLQPLDIGILAQAKAKAAETVSKLHQLSTDKAISSLNIPFVLSLELDQCCSPDLVQKAFRKSGIAPVDPAAVDWTQVPPPKLSEIPCWDRLQNDLPSCQQTIDCESDAGIVRILSIR